MLILLLFLSNTTSRAKRFWAGDSCTPLYRGVGRGAVVGGAVGGCGVGLGAAPISPSIWGPAEDEEEGEVLEKESESSDGEAER